MRRVVVDASVVVVVVVVVGGSQDSAREYGKRARFRRLLTSLLDHADAHLQSVRIAEAADPVMEAGVLAS